MPRPKKDKTAKVKKKRGRPKLADPKSRRIDMRLTEGEYLQLKEYADSKALTITQVLRQEIMKLIS